ncbi:phosphoserine phosphatase SerB [Roseiterribacter gracilis]
MDYVATLIAGPSLEPGALAATVANARDALASLGAEPGAPDVLHDDRAIDLPFADADPDQADSALRRAIGNDPIDVIAQPTADRRKRLLLADLESTIIGQEMLDELAELVGLRDRIADITARAMNGELDFRAALIERVALLKDLPEASLDEVAKRITLHGGAASLLATMREAGAHCVLVSGGFTRFAEPVAATIGFHEIHANVLELGAGKLTGTVREPVRDKDDKLRVLKETAARLQVPLAATLSVGDGANDLPMLLAAGLGVAYHAKPAVRTAARARLDYADLSGLLYAQGFRAAEIITP